MAELLASLSLAIDLGVGQPMEWVLRCCLSGVRLAEALGLGVEDRQAVFYLSLLRHIGCTGTATNDAMLFGDELTIAEGFVVDTDNMAEALGFLFRHVGTGRPPLERARMLARLLAAGPQGSATTHRAHCEVAARMADTLNFGPAIVQGLWQIYERWDGKGTPGRLKGEQLALPVRVIQVAQDAVCFCQVSDVETANELLRRRAGHHLDPAIVERFCRIAPDLLAPPEVDSTWDAVLATEPGPRRWLAGERLDLAALTLADFADLKSPSTLGHSRRVAELAAAAAERCRLPGEDVVAVRRAGLIHDLGRVGISASLWNKPGALNDGEWERVRLHPHYTERVFARSPALAELGTLAAQHRERLDGSGYHHHLTAARLSPPARLLAAADVYQAMTEPRAYRPARLPGAAADELRREVRAGRLDGDIVDAVLSVAGHSVGRIRRATPAGLSEREIDVLRLIARGHSNRQMARLLSISEKTVSHHVQHIYDKIDVSTRAAATLFAVQHDLLDHSEVQGRI